MAALCIEIDGIGSIPIELSDHPHATAVRAAFTSQTTGRVHRAEPIPPSGSIGPPYALVQMSINDSSLAKLPPGGPKLRCGSLCLVGGASDLFISLAKNNEHDGWEGGMTCIGAVPEPALTTLIENVILRMPTRTQMHPTGVKMTMLAQELPCKLVCK